MTRVLIMFGTTDGQTRKIAEAIAQRLNSTGMSAEIFRAGEGEPPSSDYDGIIVAGSVHAGRYQKPLLRWVQKSAAAFGGRPTAFVSVSLGILQTDDPAVVAELDAIVRRFCDSAGWQPGMVKHIAGALLYTRYNFVKRWIMKRISAKAGGATDTSRDYEYTDWNDVNAFADRFARNLALAAVTANTTGPLVGTHGRQTRAASVAVGALLLALLPPALATAQSANPAWKQSARGGELYRTYCAVCHGAAARGDGPLASSMTRKPPDLTEIANRNGGVFPSEMVFRTIDGKKPVRGHGGPDMPVWGDAFARSRDVRNDEQVRMMIQSLVDYLEFIQAKVVH